MNVWCVGAFLRWDSFSYRYIGYVHEFTSSQGIEIGNFCTDIATCCSNGMDFYDSFFVKSERPKKCKKIICTWVAIYEYLRYLATERVYHTPLVYPTLFWFAIFYYFIFLDKKLLRIRIPAHAVIAMSATLNTAKYLTDIMSVTDQKMILSHALRAPHVTSNTYHIFS